MKIYNTTKQHQEKGLSDRDRKEIKQYGIILKDAQRAQIKRDLDFRMIKPVGKPILKDIWDQKILRKNILGINVLTDKFQVIKLIDFMPVEKRPFMDEIFKAHEYEFSFDVILYLLDGKYIKKYMDPVVTSA